MSELYLLPRLAQGGAQAGMKLDQALYLVWSTISFEYANLTPGFPSTQANDLVIDPTPNGCKVAAVLNIVIDWRNAVAIDPNCPVGFFAFYANSAMHFAPGSREYQKLISTWSEEVLQQISDLLKKEEVAKAVLIALHYILAS